jgi:hypothetical protein
LALKNLVYATISAVAAFLLTSSSGCGTDAKGIDDCRDIERARCQAAAPCGIVTDVEECQRYYRDHCLHGLAVESPPRNLVDECVGMINRAGTCVTNLGADPPLSECPGVTRHSVLTPTVCDLIRYPERADECSFLQTVPLPEPAAGAGGESSNPAAGGAGG